MSSQNLCVNEGRTGPRMTDHHHMNLLGGPVDGRNAAVELDEDGNPPVELRLHIGGEVYLYKLSARSNAYEFVRNLSGD